MEFANYVFSGVLFLFGVIGILLRMKDDQQQKAILTQQEELRDLTKVVQTLSLQLASSLSAVNQMQKENQLLFQMHNADAKELADLKLQIAAHHYQKEELDVRFSHLDNTFRDGMEKLGDKFDALGKTLIEFMSRPNRLAA